MRAGRFDLRQVAFVQHDDDVQFLVVPGEQAARQQLVVEGGFGGDDDDELGDVGRDDLLFEGVGAVEQAAARGDAFDDALVAAGARDLDPVSAGDFAFLAAWHAFQHLAIRQFRQIVTPVCGDDQSVQRAAQIFSSASTFAAQMKSFSDRPPTAWVVYSTRHLL